MKLSILGSTGSIGVSTLDVIDHINSIGSDRIEIDALIAGQNVDLIVEQARKFQPNLVVLQNESCLDELRGRLADTKIECAVGETAILEAMSRPIDKVMAAISGTGGLLPTMAAAEAGHDILLANKEAMVCAGPLLKAIAQRSGSAIIPVDSEHNAILQCLDRSNAIESVTLTASGGPFRTAPIEAMARATPAEALAHPNWAMGAKNSLDSATMMNKGLELIEAVYLFDLPQSKINVVVHPQSIIHSLVSYIDGSCLAQMGTPDMRTPIAYALSEPGRYPTDVKRLNLIEISKLDFEALDEARFPAIRISRDAADAGMLGTSVFNAANEAAGLAFLQKQCGFLDISRLVSDCLSQALDRRNNEMPHQIRSVDDVMYVTETVRSWVAGQIRQETGNTLNVAHS
ncbi:MAG: 1-deoxy-D-xylulose-5-phosphate reductoisomerase [Ponticaulis sp.]|nr:1-deoxy-D-xylulose-5-phosphate reductoisomerase [Ponticaulis sp.]|tara:strand:- start:53276 stop:54481 length:1206 start_codon:yes stop_codon:yes gene_type:complete